MISESLKPEAKHRGLPGQVRSNQQENRAWQLSGFKGCMVAQLHDEGGCVQQQTMTKEREDDSRVCGLHHSIRWVYTVLQLNDGVSGMDWGKVSR